MRSRLKRMEKMGELEIREEKRVDDAKARAMLSSSLETRVLDSSGCLH